MINLLLTINILLGAPWCHYCEEARKDLDFRKIEYEYVDLTDTDDPLLKEILKQHKVRYVPMFFIKDGDTIIKVKGF